MPLPILQLPTEAYYKSHYEANYCCVPTITFDGIPVYFSKIRFEHAFFESSMRDGAKDQFSPTRAQRMDWIRYTLQSPAASLYQGWDNKRQTHDPTRRVAVVVDDFVVIIRMKLKRDSSLKADFITCFQADNSINLIRQSQLWDLNRCIYDLSKKKGR